MYRGVYVDLRLCVLMMTLLLTTMNVFAVRYSRAGTRVEGTRELIEKIRQYPNDGGLVIRLKKSVISEKNPELQQQGLALFALNAILRGHIEAGVKARGFLLKKYPESLYSQVLDMRYIGCVCTACGGNGGFAKNCPMCHGTGSCSMCKGSGAIAMELTNGEDLICPQCNGGGECPACNGTGDTRRVCHKCHGLGFLLDKIAIKAVYKAVLEGTPQLALPKEEDQSRKQFGEKADGSRERVQVKREKLKIHERDGDVLKNF